MSFAPPVFDFTARSGRPGWAGAHDLAPLTFSAEGLTLTATGDDPYAIGPTLSDGTLLNRPLWLRLRIKSAGGGTGQVFYFSDSAGPSEGNSVRFAVRAGGWREIRVPLPAQSNPGFRLRLDPPGARGAVTVVASIDLVPRVEFDEPSWPAPTAPNPLSESHRVLRSGELALFVDRRPGQLRVEVDGVPMAAGHDAPRLGYQLTPDSPLRWMEWSAESSVTVVGRGGAIIRTVNCTDRDGARWVWEERFSSGKRPGTVAVETRLSVDRARFLVFAPAIALLPGYGNFGARHDQAIFCGLEYLDNDEPSSSEADIRGPGSKRAMPARHQVTVPLMAIQQSGRHIALFWEPSPMVAPCFDAPDRHFGSGAHLFALFFPGDDRSSGHLLPGAGVPVGPGATLSARSTIAGGPSDNALAAVKTWVAVHGLPPIPDGGGQAALVRLASAGWLDSKVKVEDRYRHAFPGDFGPQVAADAAAAQAWLATRSVDSRTSGRLRDASAAARRLARPGDSGGVGHVHTNAAPLVFGGARARIEDAERVSRELLNRFEPDGTVLYRPGSVDLGVTHFARHANGLSAPVLSALADTVSLTGDPGVRAQLVRRLRQTDVLYRHKAPRGAQTWEVPLHTPDILASAHLVKAYTIAYLLTGEGWLRDAAIYWAWSGVPFVYLTRPTSDPVGVYASVAVFGATGWVAPNWMGLPVQWCGLVYADALYDLAVIDTGGPWRTIADGLVESGIQHSWPAGPGAPNVERQGLLPDSFDLNGQTRNDVAINPATLLVPAARRFGHPLYDRRALIPGGAIVHAPGAVTPLGKDRFLVRGWPVGVYEIVVANLPAPPRQALLNNRRTGFDFRVGGGWLIVKATGDAEITLRWQ